jgi:hypothetical protein
MAFDFETYQRLMQGLGGNPGATIPGIPEFMPVNNQQLNGQFDTTGMPDIPSDQPGTILPTPPQSQGIAQRVLGALTGKNQDQGQGIVAPEGRSNMAGYLLPLMMTHIGAALMQPPEQRGQMIAQLPATMAAGMKMGWEGNKADLEKRKLDLWEQKNLGAGVAGKNLSLEQLATQLYQKGDIEGARKVLQLNQDKKAPGVEKNLNDVELFLKDPEAFKQYQDMKTKEKTPRIGLTMDAGGNPVYAELQPGMPGPKPPAPPLDPQAVDYVAKIFMQTGEMPAMGMGAADFRKAVLGRAAQMSGAEGGNPNDVVQNKAFYGSLKTGLTQLEKQKTLLEPFMETFDRNIDVALNVGNKVDRTGIPVVNAWWNAGRRSVSGNPDISAFDAATKTVVNEFTRITTTANAGNTQMAEQEIKKMENLLNTAQTPEQYLSVLDVMKKDTQNRKNSLENGINLKRKQIGELQTGNQNFLKPKAAATQQVGPGKVSKFVGPGKYNGTLITSQEQFNQQFGGQ